MATIPIRAFFTDAKAPKTGLTVTINIYRSSTTHIIEDGAMTELGDGWYYFANSTVQRGDVYMLDGSATLSDPTERYQYGEV